MGERRSRYRTGRAELDEAISDLIETSGITVDEDQIFEMVVSALRLGFEDVGRGDRKLVNAALKELRYAFHVFAPYKDVPKATIFGSARIKVDEPAYITARDFGAAMAERDWMVMTGAGPGIMAAGLEGAGSENSFGINIRLPFEASANEFIADDPKLINFRYFFTRKLTFMKESTGYAMLPGGFGTLDETFELLTLMQTGKSNLTPVVLLEPEGGTYWQNWRAFVERELQGQGLITADDLALVHITSDVTEATEEICGFYSTYHSARYVGQRLILRLKRRPSDEEIVELNGEFSDVLAGGQVERVETTNAELADGDHVDLDRIGFAFDRSSHARLRMMIDALNGRRRS
ncbi:MAG: LOG family protein [Acidobacteria bacterium]|nr:LOG family protein [Acidobacteriota bacterium]